VVDKNVLCFVGCFKMLGLAMLFSRTQKSLTLGKYIRSGICDCESHTECQGNLICFLSSFTIILSDRLETVTSQAIQ
jgi:hypothetical protein